MPPVLQHRLFRLLLLFAVIPLLLLTGFGCYLILSLDRFSHVDSEEPSQLLLRSQQEHILDGLEAEIHRQVQDSFARATLIDFVGVVHNNAYQSRLGVSLNREQVEALRNSLTNHSRGSCEVGNQLLLYVSERPNDSTFVVGGAVFDSSYVMLLRAVENERGARARAGELRLPYLFFLGGLMALLSGLVVIGAYVLSHRYSQKVADPIVQLTEASQRIAAGEFRQSITAEAEGEIKTLIDSFNQMARQLDEATARLAQTQRVAAWRQVARRFAHELKNPLQPILVSLYRIEQQLKETSVYEVVREPLQAAADEVKHLTELADRFSQLAKLPPAKLEPVDLGDLVRSVLELYKDRAPNRSLRLSLPEKPVRARIDAAYMREALHNLLQNAIDATSEGGRIDVGLSVAANRIVLTVTDSGSGMDTATLAWARLPYFTTKEKGTGLGLAIVEKSIGEMNGQLMMQSTQGVGTTVTIMVPREMES